MSVAPTSQIAIAKHALRRLVAASAVFQSLVNAADQDEALVHVYLTEAVDDVDEVEPLRLVCPRPRAIIQQTGFAVDYGVGELQEQFTLMLSFEFPPPASVTGGTNGRNITDETTWFDNQWGGILNEMVALSGGHDGTNGYFALTTAEVVEGPMPNNPREDAVGEYYFGVSISIGGPFP